MLRFLHQLHLSVILFRRSIELGYPSRAYCAVWVILRSLVRCRTARFRPPASSCYSGRCWSSLVLGLRPSLAMELPPPSAASVVLFFFPLVGRSPAVPAGCLSARLSVGILFSQSSCFGPAPVRTCLMPSLLSLLRSFFCLLCWRRRGLIVPAAEPLFGV